MFHVYELLENACRWYPNSIAISSDDKEYTYASLDAAVTRLAVYMREQEVCKNNRVLIYMKNSVNFIISLFACAKIDAVFVLQSNQATQVQIAYCVDQCVPKLILTDEIGFTNSLKQLAGTNHVCILNQAFWDEIALHTNPCSQSKTEQVGIDIDLACILYTSGTTGTPKGVMLSHRNILLCTMLSSDVLGIQRTDKFLCLLPFSFVFGLSQMLIAVRHGAQIVTKANYLIQQLPSMIAQYQITAIFLVPTSLLQLIQFNKDIKNFDNLRLLTVAGSKIPSNQYDKVLELFGDRLFIMYGQTEARISFLKPQFSLVKKGSVGMPLRNMEVRIQSEGRLCEPGETGEIICRGGIVAQGYWQDVKLTEQTFQNSITDYAENRVAKGSKWLFTGDIGYVDEDGFLYIVDGKNQLIKHRGFRVSPLEIEECLLTIPGVSECCVIGIADDLSGEKIVALYSGDQGVFDNVKQAKSIFHKRLPQYMFPSELIAVDELPHTASGKINRVTVYERYMKITSSQME